MSSLCLQYLVRGEINKERKIHLMNRQHNQRSLGQSFLMIFHSGNLFQLLKTTKLQFFSLRKTGAFNMGKKLKYIIFQGTEILYSVLSELKQLLRTSNPSMLGTRI